MERSFAICTKETRKIRMLRISTPPGIPVPAFEDFDCKVANCKLPNTHKLADLLVPSGAEIPRTCDVFKRGSTSFQDVLFQSKPTSRFDEVLNRVA